MDINTYELFEPNCYECPVFSKCLSGIFEDIVVRCVNYSWLQAQVNDTINKLNLIGSVYPLSQEEIMALIENMKE